MLSAQDSSEPLFLYLATLPWEEDESSPLSAENDEERVSQGGDEDESSPLSGWTAETEEHVSQGGAEDESSTLSSWTTESPERDDEALPGWGEAGSEARHPSDESLADFHPFAVDVLGGRVRGIVF